MNRKVFPLSYFNNTYIFSYFSYSSSLRRPNGYWKDINNQKNYMKELEKKFNITHPNIWNSISAYNFEKNGGKCILLLYNSYFSLLQTLYPDNHYNPLQFYRLPKLFYKKSKHKYIFDLLKDRLMIQSSIQWFYLTSYHYKIYNISPIINQYSSILELLQTIYPNENWLYIKEEYNKQQELLEYNPWIHNENTNNNSTRLPSGYWNSIDNQRQFLDYIADKYNITTPQEWSSITTDIIRLNGGRQLLRKYKTFYDALECIYLEKEFNINTVRSRVSNNYWNNIKTQRLFMDNLIKKLNLKSPKDFKNISVNTIINSGGATLVRYYDSYYELLQKIYPEISWSVYDFKIVPWGYWGNVDNIKSFIDNIKIKYKIKQISDWYRISDKQIRDSGGAGLLRKFGNKETILQKAYPNIKWNSKLLSRRDKRSSQRWLFCQVQELLKDEEIIEDFIIQDIERDSQLSVEMDIYIPKYKIALEYQGEHHYRDIPSFGGIEMYTTRDKEKVKLCKQNNIKLVIVPYWWDGKQHTLKDMIYKIDPSIPCIINEEELHILSQNKQILKK